MKLPILLLFITFLFWKADVYSQNIEYTSSVDSNSVAILPGAGYDSDGGFALSALYQKVTYNPNWNPYKKLFRVQGSATFKGNFFVKSDYEYRSDDKTRINITLYGERIESAYFFGIGSESNFNQSLWNQKYYSYARWFGLLRSEVSIPVTKARFPSDFLLIQADFQYFSPDAKEGTLFSDEPPTGRIDGWGNRIGGGFYSDKRDNPFRPQQGYQVKVFGSLAPFFLGNRKNYMHLNATGSLYASFHFIKDITFAGRARYWQAIGDPPFFDTPFIGGQYDLRGYPFERFRDKGVLNYNLELRTWLFKLPFWNIEAGGQLFLDGGWVFDQPSNIDPTAMKWNAGFGGISTVFRSDFLIRADFGFSPEIWRMSLGMGYLF